ncbi:hypothetical protein ACFXGT_32105 [Streptomyces sp. NPDC059352]|uniref:hypothetical protein n=1 Tax=Streptomyces sp. NPDC059352 TaxID=3346810 RepID=UPI00368AFB69
MIHVCFAGITGWTAPPLVAALDAADDLTLTAGVSRSAAGRTLADAVGSAADGRVCATVAEALDSAPVDVLIDYTSAVAVKDNVWTAVRAGVHAVVGSSGRTADDYEELDARAHGAGVVAAGNFSVMAADAHRHLRPRRSAGPDALADPSPLADPDAQPAPTGSGHTRDSSQMGRSRSRVVPPPARPGRRATRRTMSRSPLFTGMCGVSAGMWRWSLPCPRYNSPPPPFDQTEPHPAPAPDIGPVRWPGQRIAEEGTE